MASGAPRAPDFSASHARFGSGGQRARARADSDAAARQAPSCLCHAHYRSLVRLAALLTGDALLAEQIAADSLLTVISWQHAGRAPERELFCLRQQVVARSRRSRGVGRAARTGGARGARGERGACGEPGVPWQASAVVRALLALPARQREAAVLTYYLDLQASDTAAVMGTSERAVERLLVCSREALESLVAGEPGTSA
jgi:DNA-directed RNA polymerase specialized sigma24 family protein